MKRKIMNVPASVRNLFNDMTQEERENYKRNLGLKHEQWCYLMDEETLNRKYALVGKDVWYDGSLYHVKSLDYNGSFILSLVSDEENHIEIVDDIGKIVE